MKIEESEKAGSHRELNPGHLWLEPPVLCHWATTAGQPPALTILYMYCTSGTECLSRTSGSHSVCASIEDCEGWWLSGCCGSVAEHWRLKPEVSWVQLPVTAGFFTFLYFHLTTSKFIYFQREARCFEYLASFVKNVEDLKSLNYRWMFVCQPWVQYPSCRHTTVASVLPQESPQTVPQVLFMQISTLPSIAMLPPASRSWPGVQGAVKLHQQYINAFLYDMLFVCTTLTVLYILLAQD